MAEDHASRAARYATPRAILIAGWLVFLLGAYPGYMTTAAVDQLIDSRYGAFTDWHSPVMTEVWRIVGVVVSGPAGMLIVQSGLVLFGAYAILRRAVTARAAAIASACLLVFPPIMAGTAVVSQDGQLAGFLIASAAGITSPRRSIRLVGLGLAVLACGMRDGAAVAAMPIVVLGFVWSDGQRAWLRYGIAGVAWLAIAAAAAGLTLALVDNETRRPEARLATYDVVGVLAFADPIDDADVRAMLPGVPLTAETGLQRRARAVHGKPDQYANGPDRLFEPRSGPAETAAIIAGRHRLVRAYPKPYAASRWYQFARVLGLAGANTSVVYTTIIPPSLRDPALHAAQRSAVQRLVSWPMRVLSGTVVFEPYVYLAIAILVFPIAVRRRQRGACALLASGVAYELSWFVSAPDAEFRYSHWLIACTALAVTLLVIHGASVARTGSPSRRTRS